MANRLIVPDGTYRAAWVIPVDSAPLSNAAVTVNKGKVVSLGRPGRSITDRDLGNVAIIPALINAHTHLEFSDFTQPVGSAGMPLPNWIAQVVNHRKNRGSVSPAAAIHAGIDESLRMGIGAIGEIATYPRTQTDYCISSQGPAIATTLFAEILGLTAQRQTECLQWAENLLDTLDGHSNIELGLSPHAPYSVPVPLLRRCLAMSADRNLPVAMHVAESREEIELLQTGTGPFYTALTAMGLSPREWFPAEGGIQTILNAMLAARRALIIHGNYLSCSEMDSLAGQTNASVVYCPRTHHFFRHDPHPILQLQRRGIRVVLGTDSRASNPDLSVWREVQFLRDHRQDLPPEMLLRMITAEAGIAIGFPNLGRIAVGSPASLLQVPLTSHVANAEAMMQRLFDRHPSPIASLSAGVV
jgi:cytosine/adenosine deaminase-related metal-dependent hydrolase